MNKLAKSIIEDKDNPLYPLQLQNVANAKTEEELKKAVDRYTV